ncbi:MAG: hypothetical protein KIS78_12680 [Labilithrix sp.]|nr:hypothetical protein [Labilithrix sp.]
MKKILALAAVLLLAGCDDARVRDAAKNNQLRAPAAPGRAGVPDDSIKPVAPAKVGVPDDSIKPAMPAKVGVPDDSIKPAMPAKAGVPDDSIKPAPKPPPAKTR